ncbi:Heat shock 70 kDa protein 13 [Trichinella pseudospiralis]|uniref:Heat shock 70 kDa protein 13 n=1 Tax=Trichinella pseudospiralis TaxID=6337 RepID=A0A0V1FHG1_TRIPS|nr:Heat shock 70 kDa protein 13 [Trichinella pseudospiralis]
MTNAMTIVGSSIIVVLIAGYIAQKYLPPPKPAIVGIDLGTTFSCVSVFYSGKGTVEVIPDELGRKTIPSVVAIPSKNTYFVGYNALELSNYDSSRVFYDAKRFIGQQFTEAKFNMEKQRYPFNVMRLNGTVAVFEAGHGAVVELYKAEEISSFVLSYLKKMAENYLKVNRVQRAVMSVPAEFDELQRNATIEAARLAGIEVLRLISEPTAAALAYGLHKKENTRHVVIFDLGGGTLDVSVLIVLGGMFITRAIAGHNHLGGQDFNHKLFQHLMQVIEEQYGFLLTDEDDLHSLRMAVEQAKLQLTNATETLIEIQLKSLTVDKENHHRKQQQPVTFSYQLTRDLFEKLNHQLFLKVLKPIEAALADANMKADDVDEVVMVGGSTRIPKIRYIVSNYFNKSLNCEIDPELAVAIGVGVQAGVMAQAWPVQVSATEIPFKSKKIHIYDDEIDLKQ